MIIMKLAMLQHVVCLIFYENVSIFWKCVFNFFYISATADKDLQWRADPGSLKYPPPPSLDHDETDLRAKFKILLDDYKKIMTDLVHLIGRLEYIELQESVIGFK